MSNLIGQGAYGCVYYPALPCNKDKNKDLLSKNREFLRNKKP